MGSTQGGGQSLAEAAGIEPAAWRSQIRAEGVPRERVARLERDAIAEALRTAGGKKLVAARLLGISRPTLDKKSEGYGLTVARRQA